GRRRRRGGRRAAHRIPMRPATAAPTRNSGRPRRPGRVPWRENTYRYARRSDRMTQPTTIGALRETAYRPKSVKEEPRGNLIPALGAQRDMFQRIVGYETTVIPQIQNAHP